jgi:hypothetical protein
MAKMFRSEEFQTPMCRLSFGQDLFKPRTGTNEDGSAYEKYGCTLIFKNEAKAELEKIVAHAIVQQWGEKGLERAKAGLIKSPFLKGDGKEARNKETGDLHPGMGPDVFFIRPNANYAPHVRWKSPNLQATPEDVYSGCYGKAVLTCYTWNNKQNGDGVSFGISMFQKKEEGERLGGSGGTDVSKWFEKIEDTGSAPDATKSGAGAGGLFA